MAIRYFATNRDMEKLGRRIDIDRSKRLELQRGGYYFVDMTDYMGYYLGTVESTEVPDSAIVKDSKTDIFKDFLSHEAIGRIVVCVHGFNVELYEAYTWFRVLTDTMRNAGFEKRIVTDPGDPPLHSSNNEDLTAFIGFSWPSNGSVVDYLSDQRDAVGSSSALANLLARLHVTGKSVNLLCHSMGNYLACHMLAELVNEKLVPRPFTPAGIFAVESNVKDDALVTEHETLMKRVRRGELNSNGKSEKEIFFVDNYVMLAPDVERRHVTKSAWRKMKGSTGDSDYVGPYYSGLQHLVCNVHNVYSRFDTALTVSDIEKSGREAVLAGGALLGKLTFGLLDFRARNPDQKWEKRLGEAPHPPNAPPNLTSINATELAGRKIDHSDHIDSPEVARRIAQVLAIEPDCKREIRL